MHVITFCDLPMLISMHIASQPSSFISILHKFLWGRSSRTYTIYPPLEDVNTLSLDDVIFKTKIRLRKTGVEFGIAYYNIICFFHRISDISKMMSKTSHIDVSTCEIIIQIIFKVSDFWKQVMI